MKQILDLVDISDRKIYFVGIGGIGMSAIAQVLHHKGYRVCGSDISPGPMVEKLKELGIPVAEGHSADNIRNNMVVVYTSAADSDNPELAEARRRELPMLKRAQMLALLLNKQMGITIAGTHGKTTTAAIAASILKAGNLSPCAMVGGEVVGWETNVLLGRSQYYVAEADESDGSLLYLRPHYAIITNVEPEHMEYFGNEARVWEVFSEHLSNVAANGKVYYNADDRNLASIISGIDGRRPCVSYSIHNRADIYARDISPKPFGSSFLVTYLGKRLGTVELGVPGFHNVSNSLGAIALGLDLGVGFDRIRSALRKFKGVSRRFQVIGNENNVLVIDDYAHHPTEIEATIHTARIIDESRRIIGVFQPHRYSRTRDLHKELAQSLSKADKLILTDVYSAFEEPLDGIDGRLIFDDLQEMGYKEMEYCEDYRLISERLFDIVRSGDTVLIMGAGSIESVPADFVSRLKFEPQQVQVTA